MSAGLKVRLPVVLIYQKTRLLVLMKSCNSLDTNKIILVIS
jgi:hypothetical protein